MSNRVKIVLVALAVVLVVQKLPTRAGVQNKDQAKAGDAAVTEKERPFREAAQAFVDAYAKRDAEAIGRLFTKDAEFYDEFKERTQGRDAIVQLYASVFNSDPGAMIESIDIERVRYVNDTVALEEGVVTATDTPGGQPFTSRFVALHVKDADGLWRINTLKAYPRETGGKSANLDQLEWLIGEWVSEDENVVVHTECKWSEDGNYLLRRFTVEINGEKVLDGVQRIGWDPLRRQLRSWTFDSSGGFVEGFWSRNGNQWIVTSSGVTAEGEPATGTAVYRIVDRERVTWEYRNLVVGSELREDLPPVTMVRRPPAPHVATK